MFCNYILSSVLVAFKSEIVEEHNLGCDLFIMNKFVNIKYLTNHEVDSFMLMPLKNIKQGV